jgi:hypothetical protein
MVPTGKALRGGWNVTAPRIVDLFCGGGGAVGEDLDPDAGLEVRPEIVAKLLATNETPRGEYLTGEQAWAKLDAKEESRG